MQNHFHKSKPYFSMDSKHTMPTSIASLMIILIMMSLFSLHQDSTWILDWEITTINSCYISFPMMMDPTSSFMASTVTFISFNIYLFSKSYMLHDQNQSRFLHILLLFIMSMIALIFSPNLMSLMLGWDGLGITSFLLVIYYPTNEALESGMVTALTNRIGDCFLLTAMALIMSQGQWNSWAMWVNNINSMALAGMCIMMAAMTKSAQMPFMVWLPEAMAAPTPVSALVHSSTLVTAGVYLIMRFYPFLLNMKNLNMILALSSSFTIIASSIWATVEYDIKKIIALSTLSHISLMMLTMSMGLYSLSFLHLLSHAMFKSLLFLTTGLHIIYSNHQQNLQNLQSFRLAPSISTPATVSLASLNAFFFTSGYYSKDLIAETLIHSPQYDYISSLIINSVSTAVSSGMIYSVRLHRVLSNSTKLVYPDGMIAYTLSSLWYLNDLNSSIRTPIFLLTMGAITMSSVTIWSLMTPHHIPATTIYTHAAPWIWATNGLMIATSACALNHKYKRTYHRYKPAHNNHMEMMFEYSVDSSDNESIYRDHNSHMSGLNFITYSPALYMMKLSFMIFTTLDQGWMMLYTSFMSNKITMQPSNIIAKFNQTTVTKWIFIAFMMTMMMSLFLSIM